MTYNFNHALNPAYFLYYRANQDTLKIGDFHANKSKISSFHTPLLKVGIYRLISIPTGVIAITASIGLFFLARLTQIVAFNNPISHRWVNHTIMNIKDSVLLTKHSVLECIHIAKALVKGEYLSSAILDKNLLDHMQDHYQIQKLHDLQQTNFVFTSGSTQVQVHQSLLANTSSEVLRKLVSSNFRESQTHTCNAFDMSVQAMFAFRRFLYTGFASLDLEILLELVSISHILQFAILEEHCVSFIQPLIQKDNFSRILAQTSSEILQTKCFEFIEKNSDVTSLNLIRDLGLEEKHASYLNQKTKLNIKKISPSHTFEISTSNDVTIFLKDQKKIQADRFFLALNSNYFYEKFQQNKQAKEIQVDLRQHSDETIRLWLKYIQTKELPDFQLTDNSLQKWINLFSFIQNIDENKCFNVFKNYLESRVEEILSHPSLMKSEEYLSKIYELQKIGHQIQSSLIVNQCFQIRFRAKKMVSVQEYVLLFDKYVYYLTTLSLDLTEYNYSEYWLNQEICKSLEKFLRKAPRFESITCYNFKYFNHWQQKQKLEKFFKNKYILNFIN